VPAERLGAIASELAVARARIDRAGLVDAVWRATWPHDRLFFASSRLVRALTACSAARRCRSTPTAVSPASTAPSRPAWGSRSRARPAATSA
jgi:hypothetical protein